MLNVSSTDGDREIDWGRTSGDYAEWRPDYPSEFYDRLAGQGIGLPGQRILDLGTGVGFLALNFARQGAIVTGVDVAQGQIKQACETASREELQVDFRVAPAEETGLPDDAFDVVTASQCWIYFDHQRAIAEVKRLLGPDGVLMLCHFCWLAREDAVARASEQLVLKHNPDWSASNWSGEIPEMPSSLVGQFDKVGGFVFDTPVPFTRESWRGRIRACRGVGAALSVPEVEAFDREHAKLLEEITTPQFTVLHRVDCFIMRPIDG